MRGAIADDTGLPGDGVDVTGLVGNRRAQRSKERASAQHCIRTIVDYVAATPPEGKPPHSIGDLARQVVLRSEAIAAARQFIADCEAGN